MPISARDSVCVDRLFDQFHLDAADGLFNGSGNWTQSGFPFDFDNVPDSNDLVTFRGGAHATYTVAFPGNGSTPVNFVTDQLQVGTNSVTFADGTVIIPPSMVPITVPSTYALDDTSTTETDGASSSAQRRAMRPPY